MADLKNTNENKDFRTKTMDSFNSPNTARRWASKLN